MSTLQQLANHQPHWSLDEFVEVLNSLLPQFLPVQKTRGRVREVVTPRLVRYYTSQNLVDEPLKVGREARYTYRHLLQMLLVRRLLAEGYGTSAIQPLISGKPDSELESLLQGGAQLTVETTNPALAFLQQVQRRQAQAAPPSSDAYAPAASVPVPGSETVQKADRLPPTMPAAPPAQWIHLEILPGLEIHVRDDFQLPVSPQEEANLLQLLARQLTHFLTQRRSPK